MAYRYPTPENFIKALKVEIIPGGCSVGCIKAGCPYCKWPVALRFY